MADDDTTDIQRILANLGYSPGPIDGAWGGKTRGALEAYLATTGTDLDLTDRPAIAEYLAQTYPGLATTKRHLASALEQPTPALFPANNRFCYGASYKKQPTYYNPMDRDIHGPGRIGEFLRAMNGTLTAHIGARSRNPDDALALADFQAFTAHLVAAAEADAFTRLYYTPGGGPNPAHWVSALLHNLALHINYADTYNLWTGDERATLVAWGDVLYDTSHLIRGPGSGQRSTIMPWPDTFSIQMLSYVSWGIATKNLEALSEGVQDWHRLHSFTQADGAMQTFLNGGKWQNVGGAENNDFYYDNVVGPMVVAAAFAGTVGVNLFQQRHNGATVQDIADWKIRYSLDWESLGTLTKAPVLDSWNGQTRYWQRNSMGGNWGWTDVYLHHFPEAETRTLLEKKNSTVMYQAQASGPLSCMFRIEG